MKKINGFSLGELIIAMGIVMMLVATALPIHHMVETEQHRIKQHQLIKLALHDKLQDVLWANAPMGHLDLTVAKRNVQITFTQEEEYVKGCATWENVRNKKEKVCLYGIPEK